MPLPQGIFTSRVRRGFPYFKGRYVRVPIYQVAGCRLIAMAAKKQADAIRTNVCQIAF